MALERRTPLKRTGPPKRRTPLAANTGLERGRPLKARSPKRATHMAKVRRPMIDTMVAAGRRCEVCPVLERLGVTTRCSGRIEGLHERRKSGAGGSRENPENLIPSCNWGNGYLEDMVDPWRTIVEDDGRLVVRDRHPDWTRLGAAADRA